MPPLAATMAFALQTACAFEGEPRDWTTRALSDWARMETTHLGSPAPTTPDITLFDERCVYTLTADEDGTLVVGPRNYTVGVQGHDGHIDLPNGQKITPRLISFAWGNDDGVFFVMALPSIWRANKPAGTGDLTAMFVFMHEFAHTQQVIPMGARFQELGEQGLPNGSTDDSIQDLFGERPGYRLAYEMERDALFAAAKAPDEPSVRKGLAGALDKVRERRAEHFLGSEAVYGPAEDLFLTLEASGNWIGFQWLIDPEGGGMEREAAIEFTRGPRTSWSQDQGFALALVLDRLSPGWARFAFGDRLRPIMDLAEQAARPAPAP